MLTQNKYMNRKKLCTSTKQLRVILDAKYEKADLNKVMKNQFQHST